MKGKSLVITVTMQEEMLNKIHDGHQGMTKCIARAQQSVWWPGLTKHIKQKVENCDMCKGSAERTRTTADDAITC